MSWTTQEKLEVRRMHAKGLSQTEIASALGRTRGQIAGLINRLRAAGQLAHQTEDPRVIELQSKLRDAYRRLSNERMSNSDYRAALFEAVEENMYLLELDPVPEPMTQGGPGHPEVAVAMYSDLQLGKKTPNYNRAIAEERSADYANTFVKLVNIQRHAHPVDEVHVWLLGDIVEGELIFPGQSWQLDGGLYQQAIVDGPRIVKHFLDVMLANFKKVHVAAVIGNHGRLGGSYRNSRAMHPDSNTDLFLYEIVRKMYEQAGQERITWDIPIMEGSEYGPWFTVDKIGEYSCLLFHGDQIKGHSTFPWYGFDKKVKGWKVLGDFPEFPMDSFRDAACGHWHVPTSFEINGMEVRVNGTFESYNMYSQMQLASMGTPKQRMMLVHPRHGWVTVEHKVYL